MKSLVYMVLCSVFLTGCSAARNGVTKRRYPQKAKQESTQYPKKQEAKNETKKQPEYSDNETIKPEGESKTEGSQLLQIAKSYLGVPYRYGGSSPDGFDCSGFVRFVYGKMGCSLPRSSPEQAAVGIKVDRENLQAGDLICFKGSNSKSGNVGHVGIVTEAFGNGNFNFIHSATSAGVRVDNSEANYWKIRYVGARRVIGHCPKP